ncbi:MAG: streptothricin hydrolase [Acidimicrobiaceae bacterium]|nr:streptothricin hydrolase [Acidimicrobiaceae bacterium]
MIVVDAQRAFFIDGRVVANATAVIQHIADLIRRARLAGALVVHLQNFGPYDAIDAPGTAGWELVTLVVEGPTESVIRKSSDDGFDGTGLAALLDAGSVRRLAICGVTSEMCVSATARSALARGLDVVVPHDAHSTYDIEAVPGMSEAIPAAHVARAAEWALGDQVEIVARAADVNFTQVPSPTTTIEQ